MSAITTSRPLSLYQERIAALAPDAAPRLVEAWMRLEHGTLDHLDPTGFDREVRVAAALVEQAPAESEDLARSFGL